MSFTINIQQVYGHSLAQGKEGNMAKQIKLTFTVDERTLKRIDRFQHERRIANRAEALRLLVKQGLTELETKDTNDNPPTQKQIDLVKKICKEKNIAPPEKFTIKAYAAFIAVQLKKEK